MKPIKRPNCGEKMQPKVHANTFAECDPMAWIGCPNCGVHGPAGVAKTERGAVRAAARLMREWIARMEARVSATMAQQIKYTDNAVVEVMRLRGVVRNCERCRNAANKRQGVHCEPLR